MLKPDVSIFTLKKSCFFLMEHSKFTVLFFKMIHLGSALFDCVMFRRYTKRCQLIAVSNDICTLARKWRHFVSPKALLCFRVKHCRVKLNVLGIQDFDFCPNLIKFYPNFTKFTQIILKFYQNYPNLNLTQILPNFA